VTFGIVFKMTSFFYTELTVLATRPLFEAICMLFVRKLGIETKELRKCDETFRGTQVLIS